MAGPLERWLWTARPPIDHNHARGNSWKNVLTAKLWLDPNGFDNQGDMSLHQLPATTHITSRAVTADASGLRVMRPTEARLATTRDFCHYGNTCRTLSTVFLYVFVFVTAPLLHGSSSVSPRDEAASTSRASRRWIDPRLAAFVAANEAGLNLAGMAWCTQPDHQAPHTSEPRRRYPHTPRTFITHLNVTLPASHARW
ncbi:hypothetical protein CPB85DRAFT_1429523 [Mucidula mucida]|nr:hypothetical protein CPB85DRAFT_1429523 [Mucidula mucida]